MLTLTRLFDGRRYISRFDVASSAGRCHAALSELQIRSLITGSYELLTPSSTSRPGHVTRWQTH